MNFFKNQLCFILLLFSYTSNGQTHDSKDLPNEFFFYTEKELEIDAKIFDSRIIEIESFTEKLQSYIDTHQETILPNREITVSKNGITLKSNKTLIFQKNTILKIESNYLERFAIIHINNARHVKVINAVIKGDRDLHLGKKGEWGHGISIVGSENIVIDNFYIYDCWGDGIYIGREGNLISKNIQLQDGVLNNNRRNGLSVTSIDGLIVKNMTAANSNGVNPQFGLDFEANDGRDEMNNISVENLITYNNHKGGVMLSVNKMGSGGKLSKEVNFKLNGYKDFYSKKRGLYIASISDFKNLTGNMRLNDLVFQYNEKPFEIKAIKKYDFKIYIKNYSVKNPLNKNMTSKEFDRVFKLNPNIILLND